MQVQTRLPPQQVTISSQPGQPTLYTIQLPQRRTLQAYVDPGDPGRNTVHFTFFDASGKELPIGSATATQTPPSGSSQPLKLIRFSKGHFVANVTLDEGTWLFQIQATPDTGETLSAYFQPKIGG